ncbi:MAG: hypothetical protein ACP5EN_06710 [Rhodovulum sp.]
MGEPRYRRATAADLAAIVTMLADDVLGASRESASPALEDCYRDAFAEIDADPNQFLCVVEDGPLIIGTLQITFIPGLSRNGANPHGLQDGFPDPFLGRRVRNRDLHIARHAGFGVQPKARDAGKEAADRRGLPAAGRLDQRDTTGFEICGEAHRNRQEIAILVKLEKAGEAVFQRQIALVGLDVNVPQGGEGVANFARVTGHLVSPWRYWNWGDRDRLAGAAASCVRHTSPGHRRRLCGVSGHTGGVSLRHGPPRRAVGLSSLSVDFVVWSAQAYRPPDRTSLPAAFSRSVPGVIVIRSPDLKRILARFFRTKEISSEK